MLGSNTSLGDKKRKEDGGTGGIEWRQVALSFKDPANYAFAMLFFIANVSPVI
jgi:hypothetical protein